MNAYATNTETGRESMIPLKRKGTTMLTEQRLRGMIVARVNTGPLPAVIADLTQSFAEFREKYRKDLEQVQNEVDRLNAARAAASLGGNSGSDIDNGASSARIERQAVGLYAKTGNESGIRALGGPRAEMSSDSNPDGGYTVTPSISRTINQKLFDISPLGRLARRVTIAIGDSFEEPIDPSEIGASWVGEREARPETDTAEMKYLRVPLEEIYALQPITQRLLDDTDFNLGGWLEGKIATQFALSEGRAFINGDGVKKPRGLLTYTTSTAVDANRDWWTIQHIVTGADGAFAATDPADKLRDLVWALRTPYRTGASWLMNSGTAATVDKFKDADGNYLWRDAMKAGEPPTLLGYPVNIDETMPDIASGSLSIAFGNFAQAYIIVDRPGIRAMRDPYTNKPLVIFYAYKRIGGGLQNGEAVKLLKFSAA